MYNCNYISDIFYLRRYERKIDNDDIVSLHRLRLYRITAFFTVAVYASVCIYMKIEYWKNGIYFYLYHILFLTFFINYVFLNFHGRPKITYLYSIIILYLLLHIITYKSGGIKNSGGAYLLCLILYSFILNGKRTGIIFVIAGIAHFIYFFIVSEYTNWVDTSFSGNNASLLNQDYLITFLISTIIIWSQSKFIEQAHRDVIDKVLFTSKQLSDSQKEEAELKQKIAENQLYALRTQMNPHFIFNVLNSIQYYLAANETALASEYLKKFSGLIRSVLENSRNETVLLADEIRLISNYIDLEKMRFPGKFEYVIHQISSVSIDSLKIPPMLIQPLIENAIKHGFSGVERGGKINIRFELLNSNLICTVEDNGVGLKNKHGYSLLDQDNHISMALKVIEERISILRDIYNGTAKLTISEAYEDKEFPGTRAILVLPLISDL